MRAEPGKGGKAESESDASSATNDEVLKLYSCCYHYIITNKSAIIIYYNNSNYGYYIYNIYINYNIKLKLPPPSTSH